jgi:hypothetical protein
MTHHTLIAVATAALLGVTAVDAQAAGSHKGKITWAADPTAGFAQARREGKPIMIFFTADW